MRETIDRLKEAEELIRDSVEKGINIAIEALRSRNFEESTKWGTDPANWLALNKKRILDEKK